MYPILYEGSGLTLYSYPLLMGVAWGWAYIHLRRSIEPEDHKRYFYLWFLFLFVTTWLGAKLFFWIVTQAQGLEIDLNQTSFWTGGGLVFYGGLIFGLAYFFFTQRIKKFKFNLRFGEVLAILMQSHAIGRLGCFLAGCCFGKKFETHLIPFIPHLSQHPVQLYEAMGLFLASLKLKQIKENRHAILFYLFGYSLFRFILEFLRDDHARGFWFGDLSTSQGISLIIVSISFILLRRSHPFVIDKSR
jgi:phosphatidylglycerol:prolipoprotein diacylglycerol transferase